MLEVNELTPQQEAEAFSRAKVRIKTSQQIRRDIENVKTGQPKSPARVQREHEIRDVEAHSGLGDGAVQTGYEQYEERVVDARGYQEQRMRMDYQSPNGDWYFLLS